MRHNDEGYFADTWAGCSLKKEVLESEAGLIRQAPSEANGSLTGAARLLGVSYQTLHDMLENRHSDLLDKRKPAIKQKRSIMNKEKFEKIR